MRTTILLVVLALFLSQKISCQVKLDVKTHFDEKAKLKTAKAGLLAYLKQSSWGVARDVGEDYSVWLKNLNRKIKGDTLFIELDIELRTAAMINEGKLLDSRHIKDTIDLATIETSKTFEDREMFAAIESQLARSGNIGKLIKMSANYVTGGGATYVLNIIETAVKSLKGDLGKNYSNDKAIEAMAVGAKLIVSLKDMIDKQQKIKH